MPQDAAGIARGIPWFFVYAHVQECYTPRHLLGCARSMNNERISPQPRSCRQDPL